MKVKICGITNKDDAVWAINYGADYIGLNLWKDSPRHVSLTSAASWVAQLPPFANVVGVFVDHSNEEILAAVQKLNLKAVQLHGNETPTQLASLRLELEGMGRKVAIIKAFRVKDESVVEALSAYKDTADYFLLDSFVPDHPGGTGERFNWDLAVRAKEVGKPIILAGGLNPDNVAEAIKKVQPYAVDVASGVEKTPKRKDQVKLQDFITKAKKS